jgi:nucleotide-binding universal stress UspA family protein
MSNVDTPAGTGTAQDTTGGKVVVGVDGSDGSQLALDWAASKQDALGEVMPISAYHIEALGDGVGTPSIYNDIMAVLREDAEAKLGMALASHPELADRGQVVRGYPGPALVRAAENQGLLVVGSRGRSALAETLLGSVASYCVKHATVPVAVIPEGTPVDRPLESILVGADGSANADAALAWAARHVAPGGRITALGCRVPAPYALELVPPAPRSDDEIRGTIQEEVDRTIGEVQKAGEMADGVTVEVQVTDGDPRLALREAGAQADLLVVGARGHRGAAYLLLGSVTTSLVHHPTVPTVVVPG